MEEEVLVTEMPTRPQLPRAEDRPPAGPSLLAGTVVISLVQPISSTSLGEGA